MERYEMIRAAEADRDPNYLEAKRLYEAAILESNDLDNMVEASKVRVEAAYYQVTDAAIIYVVGLEDEISVAPACKCDCKGS
jgi:hypothetical protein